MVPVPLLMDVPAVLLIPSPCAALPWRAPTCFAVCSRVCTALTLKSGLVHGLARLGSPRGSGMPREWDQCDGDFSGRPKAQGSALRGGQGCRKGQGWAWLTAPCATSTTGGGGML